MTTDRRLQLFYACTFGVVGVLGVRYSDLWVGVLFLVLAALFFVGVSKKVENFVYYALTLVAAGGLLLQRLKSAVESGQTREVLLLTALIMLLAAGGLLAYLRRRSART